MSSRRGGWCGTERRPSCARARTCSISTSAYDRRPMTTAPFPTMATPSDLVGRVLGLNPGMMTGPGTNTYLVGERAPILIDTGAGEAGYLPLFETYLAERGWRQPERIVLTHRHRDHLGGVAHLRERFSGVPVAKMIHKDTDLPEGIGDLRDGDRIEADGATL